MTVKDNLGCLPREAHYGRVSVHWIERCFQPLLALRVTWITAAPFFIEFLIRFFLFVSLRFAECRLLGLPHFLLFEDPLVQDCVSGHLSTDACCRNDRVDIVGLRAANNLSVVCWVQVIPDVLVQNALVDKFWPDCVTDDSLNFEALLQESHQHHKGKLV